jgi:two-component system sensor histidine kinase/response regulator
MQNPKKNQILIVDDTIENIQLLGECLQNNGYQIIVAQNGVQALESINALPPDLILLDVMMPEMDGYEMCRLLKENPENCDIPVIFLTAKVETEDIIKGFKLGAVDYLTKPFNKDELLARVKTHLELRHAQILIEDQKIMLEKQNKELVEAAKLREDVSQIFSHDLKNPLAAIIGYPQLLMMDGNFNESEIQNLKIIEQSGYRMLDMINRSVDLFKMERGVYQLKPFPVNILSLIHKIEIDSHEALQAKNLSLKIELSGSQATEDDTFLILGEELLCYSMISNLLKNAIEATPPKEQIHINLFYNGFATIMIHNKGNVPEPMREKFFAKYSTFGKIKGTGLGTYSAKLIAKIHQGTIDMESSENHGTTITIKLPEK